MLAARPLRVFCTEYPWALNTEHHTFKTVAKTIFRNGFELLQFTELGNLIVYSVEGMLYNHTEQSCSGIMNNTFTIK